MKLKKNWFSFIIWALVSVMSGIYLAINVIHIASSLGFRDNDTLIGFVCLSLIFCFALYEALSTIIRKFLHYEFRSESLKRHLHRVLVVLIFVISFFVRFSELSNDGFQLNTNQLLYKMCFYYGNADLAPNTILETVYVEWMQVMFGVFGKTTAIAIFFQFLLEELNFLLFYFFIKNISSGEIAALFLIFASCLSCFHNGIQVLSVEPLLIFYLMVALLVFTIFYKIGLNHYSHGALAEILFGVSGALCGLIAGIDIIGWVLVISLFLVLLSETSNHSMEDHVFYERMPLYAIYYAVMAIAAFLFLLFMFQEHTMTIMDSIEKYMKLYFDNRIFSIYAVSFHESSAIGLIVSGLATMWFFVYMSVPYDFARIGALLWVGIIAIQYFHMNLFSYQMINSLFSLVYCVGGVYGIAYHQKYSLQFAGKKGITFEEDFKNEAIPEEALEPDASIGGDESWNQIFQDGRVEVEGSEILLKQPVPVKANSPISIVIPDKPDTDDIPEPVSDLKIEPMIRDENKMEVVIHEPLNTPSIANQSLSQLKEKLNSKKDGKRRLSFTIEEMENWDYDIKDIPEDDDFDLK